MRWPLVAQQFGPHLCTSDIFSATDTTATTTAEHSTINTTVSSVSTSSTTTTAQDKSHQRWLDLRKRVIEHNVRVVARYYTRIQLPRLTQLLDLDRSETEKYISELVTAKTVYARIDRPAQMVNFARPRQPDDVLNEWSADMKSLLGLLERIDHLITKEEMMGALGGAMGRA